MRIALLVIAALFTMPWTSYAQQQKMVKILVTTPMVSDKAYRPISDVFAGSIIRELNRNGGLEIVDREASERWLRENGHPESVDNRGVAIAVGKALGADIVIYSYLNKTFETFAYRLAFIEVERDVIQRILDGSFKESVPASEIGRLVKEDMKKLVQYIPLPSELGKPGIALRQETANPDNLPRSARIDMPKLDRYGPLEQVLSYYRVFPGESEFMKMDVDQQITRVQMTEEIDAELMQIMSRFQMYGEFALRYNMQAYLIKNCSTRAINVLLANKIPVFYSEDGSAVNLLVGYNALRSDGDCVFRTNYQDEFESFNLIHRKLICVLIILPKPGKRGGISRDYLDTAIGRYQNDWGKNPALVEVKEGFLDIISSGLEND